MGILFLKTQGKYHKVLKVTSSKKDAEGFCKKNNDCGIVDDWDGHFLVVEFEESK